MPPYAVRVRTATGWQDIALSGPPGPVGPQGPNGTVVVYEQPNTPASPVIGSVWIDTDDVVPAAANFTEAIVTSLPVTPVDGQVINYLADATNGVIWRLRYRAASPSTYKWEFVGGPPLYNEVLASEQSTALGYANLATIGPQITVPLGGDYDVLIGSAVQSVSAVVAGATTYMSYAIGATGASDTDALSVASVVPGSTGLTIINLSRNRRKTGIAASTAIVAKYKITGSASYIWYHASRSMAVIPVRVG